MKNLFGYIVFLSAFLLAGTAAFFSVTGLSKLFAGSQIAVIVMASSLEFSKIVAVSFIYRYWKHTKISMRVYLSLGIFVLMITTSLGIYGFLSNAYANTSTQVNAQTQQTVYFQSKRDIFTQSIKKDSIEQVRIDDRSQKLSSLRITQENRIDTAQKRFQSAKQARNDIKVTDNEIQNLNRQSDSLGRHMSVMQDSAGKYDLIILNSNQKQSANEVGPLKYISSLTGKSMDVVANYFIMLLIFVFDPMAIVLLIAANIIFDNKIEVKKNNVELARESVSDKIKKIFIKSNEQVATISEQIKEEESDKNIAEYMSSEEISLVVQKEAAGEHVVEQPKGYVQDVVANESAETNYKDHRQSIIQSELEATDMPKIDAKNILKTLNVKHSKNFMNFLEVLFNEGDRNIGDDLPEFSKIINILKDNEISYEDKEIKDFFSLCNYLGVTNMSGNQKKITKNYLESKALFQKLSA